MKYCPNCGNQLQEGAVFCPKCGSRLDGSAPQVNTNNKSAARPVLQNRNIVTAILLSIFTLGIYFMVWYVYIVNDVNRICNDEKSSQSGGMVLLLTIITCGIYGIIWFYQAGSRMYKAGNKYGIQISNNEILYLVLSLFGFSIVNYCLIQSDLNQFSA